MIKCLCKILLHVYKLNPIKKCKNKNERCLNCFKLVWSFMFELSYLSLEFIYDLYFV